MPFDIDSYFISLESPRHKETLDVKATSQETEKHSDEVKTGFD
jgi:hypothetical protein